MDVIGWIWWALSTLAGFAISLIWFLVGGWVSALAQILVVALIIFGMKYGWQRAPFEMWARTKSFSSFVWGWIRSKEGTASPGRVEVREVVRMVRVKEPGDVNLSSLMTMAAVLGVVLAGTL